MNKFIDIEFNSKTYNVEVDNDKGMVFNIDECIKKLNSNELFDYLYNYHIDMFNEINNDPYFKGKTIKCGEDLKNSIEEIKLISCENGVMYICG